MECGTLRPLDLGSKSATLQLTAEPWSTNGHGWLGELCSSGWRDGT
jgi:hypothetical protein